MVLINFAQLVVQEIERSQLLSNGEYGEVNEQMVAVPAGVAIGFNFECGSLRAWRMRQALSEAVILVWMPQNSTDGSILYGNVAFHSMTGMCIKPSSSFPNACVELADGTTVSNSLNELMMFDGDIQKHCENNQLTPFAIDGTIFIREHGSSKSEKRIKLTCRFNPAALPLDANAAVVQPVPLGEPGSLSGPFEVPDQGHIGHLYFVTMHVKKVSDDGKAEKAVQNFLSKTPLKYHTEGAPVKDLAQSKLKQQVFFKKPPMSPFEDVQNLRHVGGRAKAPQVLFGLWSGTSVAVKVITHNKVPPESVTSLLSTTLKHPNIVSCYKFFTKVLRSGPKQTYRTWIVQEWCNGGTFSEYCSSPRYDTKQGLYEMFGALSEIACGATYLHSKGIVHGDMNGDHILLVSYHSRKRARGYTCKLCNFGFSRFDADNETEPYIGSIAYMPPERYASTSPTLTTQNDVWSFGILVWKAMTGQIPYDGFNYLQVAMKVTNGHRLQLPPACDALAKDMLKKCTETDPDSRPTMTHVKETLLQRMERENGCANIRVGYWRRSRTP
jgi:serine/threonine protein kinase